MGSQAKILGDVIDRFIGHVINDAFYERVKKAYNDIGYTCTVMPSKTEIGEVIVLVSRMGVGVFTVTVAGGQTVTITRDHLDHHA